MGRKDALIAIMLIILGVFAIFVVSTWHNHTYYPQPPPLEMALSKATGAMISRFDRSTPDLYTNSERNPDVIRSLKECRDFSGTPPALPADTLIVLYGVRGEPGYKYVSETGELGKGNEWCVASDEFRRLLREHYAKESRKRKGK